MSNLAVERSLGLQKAMFGKLFVAGSFFQLR
jgi:hypothetical protein